MDHNLILTLSFLAKHIGCSFWGHPGLEHSQQQWGKPPTP